MPLKTVVVTVFAVQHAVGLLHPDLLSTLLLTTSSDAAANAAERTLSSAAVAKKGILFHRSSRTFIVSLASRSTELSPTQNSVWRCTVSKFANKQYQELAVVQGGTAQSVIPVLIQVGLYFLRTAGRIICQTVVARTASKPAKTRAADFVRDFTSNSTDPDVQAVARAMNPGKATVEDLGAYIASVLSGARAACLIEDYLFKTGKTVESHGRPALSRLVARAGLVEWTSYLEDHGPFMLVGNEKHPEAKEAVRLMRSKDVHTQERGLGVALGFGQIASSTFPGSHDSKKTGLAVHIDLTAINGGSENIAFVLNSSHSVMELDSDDFQNMVQCAHDGNALATKMLKSGLMKSVELKLILHKV